jgi:anti-sigma-K factor RskA
MSKARLTTNELLDLAAEDLLGVLEDAERNAFDESVAAADPAVQEQVRREQSKVAESVQATLPLVIQSPDLKDRVMDRLGREAGAVTAASASETTPEMPAVVAAASSFPFSTEAAALEMAWRDLPTRRVNRYWRAASLVLAGLSVALGAMLLDSKQTFYNLVDIYTSESQNAYLRMHGLGVPYTQLHMDSGTVSTRFVDVNGGNAVAVLESNEAMGQAYLVVDGLQAGTQYELRYVLDDQDDAVVAHQFRFDGGSRAISIELASLPAGGEWRICEQGSDEALLIGKLA